jgi:demethyl-4-deoxygadusol synthase
MGWPNWLKLLWLPTKTCLNGWRSLGKKLLDTHFGYLDGSPPELKEIGHKMTYEAIKTMLELEVPNLHELNLERVIAYGHTWSPTLELAPQVPMFHGHAVSFMVMP